MTVEEFFTRGVYETNPAYEAFVCKRCGWQFCARSVDGWTAGARLPSDLTAEVLREHVEAYHQLGDDMHELNDGTLLESLDPCPFCGSMELGWYDLNIDASARGIEDALVEYVVECTTCLCHGPIGENREKAFQRWNTRVAIDEWDRCEEVSVRRRRPTDEAALRERPPYK